MEIMEVLEELAIAAPVITEEIITTDNPHKI